MGRSISFLPILFSLLLLTGCLDKKGYIDGEFALDGFTFDVIAPDIEIFESRPGYANNSNVVFKIDTGSNRVNCESFTHFTITTSSSTPAPSAFTDTCTTSGTQFKTINAGSDGLKAYYIHAMSAQGKFSAPKSVKFVLDTTPPTVNFTDIGAGPFRGGSNVTLNYNASDLNGLESFVMDFAEDGTNFVNDRSIPFGASGGLFVFPTTDITTNVLRVVAVDNAGNTTTVSSSAFETDSTPPAITLNNLPSIVQGASAVGVSFTASDLNGIGSSSLLFSADGVSFVTEALNPTSIYSWTVPSIDQQTSAMRYVVSDSVGNTSTATTASFIIDSTPPAATLTDLAPVIKGGSLQNVTFTNSDLNGIASISLDYAADGTNFTTNLTTTNTSPFSWTTPITDTTGSRIRLTVTDNAGHVTQVTSAPFNIDSTGPSITLADMAAYVRGGVNNTVTFTATDANGVATKTLQYASNGTAFTDITSGMNSPYSWATPADDVPAAKLRFVAVDSVGNMSTVTNAAFVVDSTNPTGSITDLAAYIPGGGSVPVSFTFADENVVASRILEYAADGTTYSTIATDPTSAYTWSIPAANTTASKLRLTVTDAAGNVSQFETAAFDIDNSAPTGSITDLAPYVQGGSTIPVNFTYNDNKLVASRVLEYAADGVTFSTLATDPTSPYSWTVPVVDTAASKLRITITDGAGNQTQYTTAAFAIDSTAPTGSITDLAAYVKGGANTSVSFTYNDENVVASRVLEYAADGTNFTTLATDPTSAYTWSVPAVDTTASKLRITITDGAGNQTQYTTAAFVIDSTLPTGSITDLAAYVKGGASTSVSFTYNDDHGVASRVLEYAADGVTFSNIVTDPTSAYSWAVPAVNTAASKLRITITDLAGNVQQYTTAAFSIDSTAPTGSITDLAAYVKGGANTSVLFTYADENVVASRILEYAADGVTFSTLATNPTSAYTWAVPAVNTTASRLRVTITDGAGNVTQYTTAPFAIDSTLPTGSINDLAAYVKGGAATGVTFTYADDNGVASRILEYAADGTNFSTLATDPTSVYSWSVPAVNTAASRLRITITDVAGNVQQYTTAAFAIDSTAPTGSITDLAAYVKGGAATSVNFTYADDNVVASRILEYAADGVTFSTLVTNPTSAYSWSVPAVNTSASRLRITITDGAGNVTQYTTAAFAIDSTAPTGSITDLAAYVKGGAATSVNFTYADDNVVASRVLEYAADGVTFSTLATNPTSAYSWSVPAVNTSASKLRITITDGAGNVTQYTTAAFAIDSTPPTGSIGNLAALIKGGTVQGINFTKADDNVVSTWKLEYAANGTTFADIVVDPASSPYNWTAPTSNTTASKLRITITDAAGNVTQYTTAAFGIDSTIPSISLTNLAPIIRGGSVQGVVFTVTDDRAMGSFTLQYAADGVTFSTLATNPTSTYSWSVPVVDTTASKLRIVATDSVGNSNTVTSAAFAIDKTPPALPVATLASNNPSNSTAIQITISDCTDRPFIFVNEGTQPAMGAAGWQACSTAAGAITYTIAATEGTHNMKVWAKDSVGNVTTTATTVSMVYDITPPSVTVTSPANNSYAKNSVVMSGTCEIGSNVDFSGDVAANFSISCTTGSWTQNVNFLDPLVDGNKNIVVAQTDPAGNTTTVNRTYINDNLPPVITRTSPGSPILTNGNSMTWNGTCEGTYTITVSGDATGTFPCSSGTWTWTTPSVATDGTRNYSLSQTDAAGNTSTALPLQWTRDQTPPIFTKDRISPETNNKSSLVFNGTCEGTNSIAITGAATDTISCSAGSWNWTSPVVSTDGTRTYTFTQTDGPGNQTVLTHQWTRDTTGPAILVDLDKETIKSNVNSATFTGTCDMTITTTTITVSGTDSTTIPCSAGTWTYTTVAQATDATRTYNFSQTNDLSTTTTVSGVWIRETNIPTISSMSKGTGVSDPSTTNFINTNLVATSANPAVGIEKICFTSNDTTQPIATNECWVEVSSPQIGHPVQQSLNITDYAVLVGWQPIFYNVYGWVQDEAGNISNLTNAGAGTIGTDKYTITYDPGIPPVLFDVIAANSDVTANPPTLGETNVPAGADVYIRWKATDNNPLPANAITFNYTQDEINFVPITLTNPADPANPAANYTGLSNANYGCPGITLAANEGCYKWTGGSPLNVSYKIQVVVKDATDIEVKMISNPLNTGNIKLLAGNTESGLGGAAQAAMFYPQNSNWEIDPGTLVMTNTGDLYFADDKRGVITIDRADGKQKIFIPMTGSSTGDGGVATSATLIFATKIALDYQNRLLILDRNKIRRVDLNQNPPTIETIIGGGTDTSDTVADPLQVQIYGHGNAGWDHHKVPFFALPNGDIIFMSEYGLKGNTDPDHRYRIYKSATGQVISKYIVSGASSTDVGTYYHTVIDTANPDPDLSDCNVNAPSFRFDVSTSQITGIRAQVRAHPNWPLCPRNDGVTTDYYYTMQYFDPATHEPVPDIGNYDQWAGYVAHHMVTGMDGNLYQVVHDYYVERINFDGTTTRVLGSGTRGECPDGTQALSCNIGIDDFFVTQDGTFYFVDAGIIRTVAADGTVFTIAGQRRNYGDNVNALNARLNSPSWIAEKADGKITYGDAYYFKEFTIEGNVNIIAGNGNSASYQALGVDARTTAMYDFNWWEMDRTTGNIYARYHWHGMAVLDRSTGQWARVVGGGANEYWNNDGQSGSNRISNRHMLIIGIDDSGRVLTNNMKWNGTDGRYEDFMFKLYDPFNATPYLQTHVAGTNDPLRTYQGGYLGMTAGETTSTAKMPYYSYTGSTTWDSVGNRWIVNQYVHNNGNGRPIWSVTPGGTVEQIAYLPRQVQYNYLYVRHSGKEWLYYVYGGRIYYHDMTTDTDMGMLPWSMNTLYAQGYKMIYNSTRHSLIFPCNQNGLGCVAEYYLP